MRRVLPLLFFVISAVSYQSKAQTHVAFFTNMGTFTVMMYDSIVPITAGNFIELTNKKFYDGVIFHRVIDRFMIQGGDPTGTGSGGPGYTIPDEFDSTMSNVRKTISMANAGPNTGGSQFFINLVGNTYLDFDKDPKQYAHPVFGIVVDNFTVVQAIGKVPTNGQDRPLEDVVMDSVRVVPPDFSVNELLVNNGLHIYPNPISGISQMYLESTSASQAIITVFSINGAEVYNESVRLIGGNNSLSLAGLHAADLKIGQYVIQVLVDGRKYQSKVLIP